MVQMSDQYRIISTAAGWVNRTALGRLRIGGSDAVSFFQALLTNDLGRLSPGGGVYAAYLTPQGRMIADLRLHHLGDYLLVRVVPGLGERLAATFDQLVFTEDVSVSDISADTGQLTIFGSTASAVVAGALNLEASTLSALPPLASVKSGDAIVIRADDLDVPTYDCIVPVTGLDGLVRAIEASGAVPVDADIFESFRIQAGRPAFGVDMTSETIPLEAGLLGRAISTEKGCYVGQEVIIRVLHRGGGRVARRLMRLSLAGAGERPAVGATLTSDGQDVGHLTSVAPAPDGPGFIALGYVHRDQAAIGRTLHLATANGDTLVRVEGEAG